MQQHRPIARWWLACGQWLVAGDQVRHSPLASRLSTLASRLSPLASRLSSETSLSPLFSRPMSFAAAPWVMGTPGVPS